MGGANDYSSDVVPGEFERSELCYNKADLGISQFIISATNTEKNKHRQLTAAVPNVHSFR